MTVGSKDMTVPEAKTVFCPECGAKWWRVVTLNKTGCGEVCTSVYSDTMRVPINIPPTSNGKTCCGKEVDL